MFSFFGSEAPFPAMASLLSTVTSNRFSSLIVDVHPRELAQAHNGNAVIEQMEGIRMFDLPLYRLGVRSLQNTRKRLYFIILAHDPESLALGLVQFHRVGNIWAGEKVGGDEYRWTFGEAEEVEE